MARAAARAGLESEEWAILDSNQGPPPYQSGREDSRRFPVVTPLARRAVSLVVPVPAGSLLVPATAFHDLSKSRLERRSEALAVFGDGIARAW
jgi:hypothetical protein